MNFTINAHCSGFRSPLGRVMWGAILTATAEDGREFRKEICGELDGSLTKNVADLTSATLAMQCIMPLYRANTNIVLQPPPGYVVKMLERGPDGLWVSSPQTNQNEVNTLRAMFSKYSKLEVRKAEPNSKVFRELISLIQGKLNDLGRSQTGDQGSADREESAGGVPQAS